MNNVSLISVIIPCYQQAHFLAEAIQSVLAQTYPRYEIIVVDDGSTDDTAAVAGRYAALTCIRQRNMGLPIARNVGWQASKGEYVVFLDADDRLLPDALTTGADALRSRPECAFVYGFCHIIDQAGARILMPPHTAIEQEHYRKLFERNFIWTPGAAIFRRAALTQASGFDAALINGCEDLDLYLRLTRHSAICCHGQVVAEYRRHPASMSANGARMLRALDELFRKHLPEVLGDQELEALCRRRIVPPHRLLLQQLHLRIRTALRLRTRLRAIKLSLQQTRSLR